MTWTAINEQIKTGSLSIQYPKIFPCTYSNENRYISSIDLLYT